MWVNAPQILTLLETAQLTFVHGPDSGENRLWAMDGEKNVGNVWWYTSGDGGIGISFIQTDYAHHGKGIATAMIAELRRLYPDARFQVISQTDDGAGFFKSQKFMQASGQTPDTLGYRGA